MTAEKIAKSSASPYDGARMPRVKLKLIGGYDISEAIQVKPKRRRRDEPLISQYIHTRKQTTLNSAADRDDRKRGGTTSGNIDKVINGHTSSNENKQTTIVDYKMSSDGD
uniref:AlNc14C54G4155 protein n=1 Tax=Albugo laibachii Nc14 TaxID=890382 RepID=F0WBW7_9STRA|nr:AlNc14C54G4155 [Albugo laibachii Nc14]|eukprot:CCA18646.1 AlNc14C54G4155 [Albugo laibachii Nc14]